jgi:dipeptidyl aminopeptidase/acylaminoacyl peptidase
MKIFARLVIAAGLLCVVSPATAQDMPNRLTVDRYLDWEDVSGPQLSPDGSQIVYERQWIDAINDREASSIWIMNTDGSRNRFLVDGSSPVWSPDGSRIAYIASGEPEGRQIFVRWMDDEGAVSQITRITQSPSGLQWAPDGEAIAFTALVPDRPDETWEIEMPDEPAGAQWTAPPRIEERLRYRADGRGWLPKGYTHVFAVQADGGTPRQITSGDWDHRDFSWMPDGRAIVFTSLRIEDSERAWRESEIYAVDVESGDIRQLTDREGPDEDPVPSPDGRWIAYQGYDHTTDTYRENGLYVMAADGSGSRLIAEEYGRSLDDVTWADDGSGVYFNAQTLGTSNLYFAPLDGSPHAVTEGKHMLSVTDIGANGIAVGRRSSAYVPAEIVTFHVDTPEVLTTVHATNRTHLAEVELGEVEEIWYESEPGVQIQGWIVKPPGFDPSRDYPLILRIHGGPHSMYNTGFDFKNQNHAAHDYVVLYTNPRGSSGYGSEFGNAIKFNYPGPDYIDLMAGVDEVIGRGYIDERNLFVYGGSGGGVLTAWIVGHTDRFTAAVSKAPVINWTSFIGTTDGPSWYRNFEHMVWDDPEEHLRRSPLMYVGNVSTPTMLMTGERDLRTPMEQTEQFYRALKMKGVPTAMVRLTDGWHSRNRPPTNFIRVQLYLRNWFERYMVTSGQVAAPDEGEGGT